MSVNWLLISLGTVLTLALLSDLTVANVLEYF